MKVKLIQAKRTNSPVNDRLLDFIVRHFKFNIPEPGKKGNFGKKGGSVIMILPTLYLQEPACH